MAPFASRPFDASPPFFVAARRNRLRDWRSDLPVKLRRLFLTLFVLLFAGLGVVVGLFFLDARDEYNRLKSIQLVNKRHLEEIQAELAEQQRILERLQTDPAYVERVIRRRLGYAKPEEYIFRFDE